MLRPAQILLIYLLVFIFFKYLINILNGKKGLEAYMSISVEIKQKYHIYY